MYTKIREYLASPIIHIKGGNLECKMSHGFFFAWIIVDSLLDGIVAGVKHLI